jgi:succinate dehydrogenase / fumarate reductase cytochrome b subunit
MNTAKQQILHATIGKKAIMALTGLFLCSFLVIHLLGNLQLLADDNGQSFNVYSKFMAHNPIIKIIAYVNYIAILSHVIYSLVLTLRNRKARPVGYAANKPSANSIWSSRNMGILGTLILAFIIVHMSDFWYSFKFGFIPMISYTIEGQAIEMKNCYAEVAEAFTQGWYVAFYTVSMAAIAFHLIHGFQSAFQTLGFNHKKYTPAVKMIGYGFAIIIPAAFAYIPLYFYFTK